jgi:cyclophilin family peptidyl-prolyl cis-trans isomerase
VTVNNFVFLAKYGYFNETICHRAIPGFVVQCGDPTGVGNGGPGYAIPDELPQAGSYKIGSLAMANAGSGTGGSQFFIVSGEAGMNLPPNYALFGQVTQGVEDVLTKLDAQGNPEQSSNGVPPLSEIRILSVKILEK